MDEPADNRTMSQHPRIGYGDDFLAHNRYQGGLRSRLPGVDDRGNFGRRVPVRHHPTIPYPSDKNTHPNNTPSGGHSETIYPKRIVQFELTG